MTIPSQIVKVLEGINEGLARGGSVVLLSVDPEDLKMVDEFAHQIHQMLWDNGMPQAADMVRDLYRAKTGRKDVL